MRTACVRVPTGEGEAVRQALLAADALDHDLEIAVEDGWLYLPVTDPAVVPEGYEVTERELSPRETQTLPADLLEEPPAYERIGDIVVLHEDDLERAAAIAEAVMASDLPAKTVINRASAIKGPERVRDWDVLVGDGTETVHTEYGCDFAVDLAAVYFSPRLATERERVVSQVVDGEHAFDMFAGVGPYAVRLARAGAEVVAVDINPAAIEYLRENAARNGVDDRITAIEGDVADVAEQYGGWADRIVMNLPHSAADYLGAAVEIAGASCVVHYYDIQPEADPFTAGETAIRDAAEPAYSVTVEDRRVVRSYAPGQVNSCLDVRLRRSE